jgi:hypothetical protein
MNEIFFLKTAHWELIIRADGIGSRESQLSQTLKSRGKTLPKSSLNLSNAIKVDKMEALGCVTYSPGEAHQTVLLSKPLFYENTLYYFEFVFSEEQRLPKVLHKLQSLCQSFFTTIAMAFNGCRGKSTLPIKLAGFICRLSIMLKDAHSI